MWNIAAKPLAHAVACFPTGHAHFGGVNANDELTVRLVGEESHGLEHPRVHVCEPAVAILGGAVPRDVREQHGRRFRHVEAE
jgi:hypothetical protein